MPRRALAFALALAGAPLVVGCESFREFEDGEFGPPEAPPAPPSAAAQGRGEAALSPDALAAAKLSRYAECYYRSEPDVRRSEAVWRKTVGEDGKPVKRRTVPEIRAVHDERGVCDAVDREGPTTEPPMPALEGAAASYADALRPLVPATAALLEYYEAETFKDDEWEAGVTMAAALRPALSRFDTAARALKSALDEAYDTTVRGRLAAVAERSIAWHVHSAMLAARAWAECIAPAEPTAPPADSKRSEDAIAVVIESCDVMMSSFVAADDGLAAGRDGDEASAVFWLTSFAHSVQHLRQLAERVHAPPPPKRRGKSKDKPPPPPTRGDVAEAMAAIILDYGQLGLPRSSSADGSASQPPAAGP